jgi:hypothetical protein
VAASIVATNIVRIVLRIRVSPLGFRWLTNLPQLQAFLCDMSGDHRVRIVASTGQRSSRGEINSPPHVWKAA